mmetsp:Transcript_7765/g.32999  ORF Transcript_7765/g.32999 Transcript_7765/m.32999 type:complete len:200 (+) Transcript_7765:192-791(+)
MDASSSARAALIAPSTSIAPLINAIPIKRLFAEAAALNVAVNSNASMPFNRFSAFFKTVSGRSAPKMLVEGSKSFPNSCFAQLSTRACAFAWRSATGPGSWRQSTTSEGKNSRSFRTWNKRTSGCDIWSMAVATRPISGMVNGRTERPLCQCHSAAMASASDLEGTASGTRRGVFSALPSSVTPQSPLPSDIRSIPTCV